MENSADKYNKWFEFKKDKVDIHLANEFNRIFKDLLEEHKVEPMKTQ
jgi:hypothetical protein